MLISGTKYTPAPEGQFDAVCVDAIEKPNVETKWGLKNKVRLVFEIDEVDPETNKRFRVGKTYTASLNEKAVLHKDLKGWFGKAPKNLDTEELVGKPCKLIVQHNETDGDTFANILAIMKPGKDSLSPSGDYTRAKDRAERAEAGAVPF